MQYQRKAVLLSGTLQLPHQRLIYQQFRLSQRLLHDWQSAAAKHKVGEFVSDKSCPPHHSQAYSTKVKQTGFIL